MKPLRITRFLLIAMAAFCVWTFNSCQVVELVISGTTYYETEITTKDNQLIAGQIGGQRSSNQDHQYQDRRRTKKKSRVRKSNT